MRTRGKDGRIPDCGLGWGESFRMAEKENTGASASARQPVGYSGEPYDTSLLVKYEHHIARHIWFGEERGTKKELKVAGHRLKLIKMVPLYLPGFRICEEMASRDIFISHDVW
ncbi:unnamed protein product [Lathyrus sativus]|nr:unnamed protein product [Lathyrus sativus]